MAGRSRMAVLFVRVVVPILRKLGPVRASCCSPTDETIALGAAVVVSLVSESQYSLGSAEGPVNSLIRGSRVCEWELFIDALEPARGEKILDVGAGNGKKASLVLQASEGAEVFAIDTDEKKVAVAKRDYPTLKSSVAEAESLPFPDSYFDKVYTTMALHHFSDLDRALSEISRVLKPRGTFVILELDPYSPRGRLFRFFGRLAGEHLNVMTQAQLLYRLKSEEALMVTRTVGLGSSFLIQTSRV